MDLEDRFGVFLARYSRRLGPPVTEWPDGTVAWCQRCDAPIRHGQPYMHRIPFVGSWAGFDHSNPLQCDRPLRIVQ